MNDEEFVARFAAGTLEPFHHADHVRAAFLYLRRFPAPEAIGRFSADLARFAASKGKPELYHETITWAYLILIRERMARSVATPTWDEFAAANGDLLDWRASILKRYYRAETLESRLAKSVFVFPDHF